MFNTGYWPILWFLIKVIFFLFGVFRLRRSLPRLRYDQFMRFGWKVLIPVSLVWIMLAAVMRLINTTGGVDRRSLFGALALRVVLVFAGEKEEEPESVDEEAAFDAFAGGYPVPPMSSATPSATPSI